MDKVIRIEDGGGNYSIHQCIQAIALAWHRRVTNEGWYDYRESGVPHLYMDEDLRSVVFKVGSAKMQAKDGKVRVPIAMSSYYLRKYSEDWGDLDGGIIRLFAYAMCEHRVKAALRVGEERASGRMSFASHGWKPAYMSLCRHVCGRFDEDANERVLGKPPRFPAREGVYLRSTLQPSRAGKRITPMRNPSRNPSPAFPSA